MASTTSDRILRFQLGDRIEHMVQLVTFVGLGLTGLIQKFHDSAISQWWIDFLGGLPTTRYIHRVLATILMVAVVYHFGKAGYRRWVERRPSSMLHEGSAVSDPRYDEEMARAEDIGRLRQAFVQLDGRCQRLLQRLMLKEPPDSYIDVARDEDLAPTSIGPIRRRCMTRLAKFVEELSRSGS